MRSNIRLIGNGSDISLERANGATPPRDVQTTKINKELHQYAG